MHIGRVYRATFSLGFCLAALVSVAADRAEFSGFLGDYSQLESITDRYVDYVYSVPDFRTRMAQYRTFIVPLPEIYIAADSEYKTIDRADRNVLADAFRESFLQQLTGKYVTVTRPGPETAMIRIALTDVDFETIKDPVREVEPSPYGDSEKLALRESLADKLRLTGLSIELEMADSLSGERLVAIVHRAGRASGRDEFASYADLEQWFQVLGVRLQCRIDNSRLPEDQWEDCAVISP